MPIIIQMTDQPPHGSKLPAKYENPLDLWLISLLVPVMPILHDAGVTPNMLTAASAGCAAVSLYFMVKGKVELALVFWGLNYMFDLADGLKARLYNEQSSFGDAADHVSDVLSVVGLYGVIVYKLSGKWKMQTLWPLIGEAVIMAIGLAQMTCQERYSQGRTSLYIPVAGVDVNKCKNVDVMRWTRWCGIATLTAWHMFLIVYYSNI